MVREKEFILSKQLLRSGTSIGANVEEAQQAQSRKDFVSKCSISLKEAYEARYWLLLFRGSDIGDMRLIVVLLNQVDEIIKMLVAIVKNSK